MKKFCVAAILTACAVPAGAQDAREEGLGIRAGGFIVDPALTIGEEFDSNVFLTDTDETDTFLTTVAPQVAITSDWNRHGVRLDLGGEAGFFTHDSDDNYFDANARLSGVLDITRDARVTARAGYVRGHEARGSDDVPLFAKEPVRTNDFESELVVTVERGRFRFEPFATYVFRDFEDTPLIGGGQANEDDRDRNEIETGLEIGYAVRSGWEAFVRGSYLSHNFQDAIDDTGVDRDATGFRALAGVKVDLTRLIEASVGLGYEHQDFDDPTLKSIDDFAAAIGVDWSITPLTTILFDASRATNDTTIAGASRTLDTTAALQVRHELLRNLTLYGETDYAKREFEGTSRDDDIYGIEIGAEWRVSRHFWLEPKYRYSLRESNAPNEDYNDHQVGLFGTVRF